MALHSEVALLSGAGPDSEEIQIESAALKGAVDDLSVWGDIDLVPGLAVISLVGRQLRSMVGISGRFFSVLGENGINIEMISQGMYHICCFFTRLLTIFDRCQRNQHFLCHRRGRGQQSS